ncbi:hypothetical protein BC834DRAFT_686319 [Gloeopeniophorella convolvens]|nr:hypothetical protein BC834DRAFT_686319 [Gloeopeniophorella convolvens]
MNGQNNHPHLPNNHGHRPQTTLTTELNQILQSGVTPEQFAENARQLEAYSRMNAMGLQIYLQRQAQQAEQRRQEELRVIQMAQQLAGRSQQPIQQLLPSIVSQVPHSHGAASNHQRISVSAPPGARSVPQIPSHVQSGLGVASSGLTSQHRQHYREHVMDQTYPSHQQGQWLPQYPSVTSPSPFVAPQSARPPPPENIMARNTVEFEGMRHSNVQVPPPTQQQPLPVPVSHGLQSLPPQGGAATVSRNGSTHASAPSATDAQRLRSDRMREQLTRAYAQWTEAYGSERANLMVKAALQRSQGQSRAHTASRSDVQPAAQPSSRPDVPQAQQGYHQPQHTRIGAPVTPNSTQFNHQAQSSGWHPTTEAGPSTGQPAPHDVHPAPPPSLTSPYPSNTYESSLGTKPRSEVVSGSGVLEPHKPTTGPQGVVVPSSTAPTTGPLSTMTAPSSTQSGSQQSLLIGGEQVSAAPYSLRGLAASIKRSLNAERLAASPGPSTRPNSHGEKRKRSISTERRVIEDAVPPKRSNSVAAEPRKRTLVDSGSDAVPRQVDVLDGVRTPSPQVLEPRDTKDASGQTAIANVLHDSPRAFSPYSTLTGAVSFEDGSDDPSAVKSPASPTTSGPLDNTAQLAPDTTLHDSTNISFVPFVVDAAFGTLPFAPRVPTPPLAATITPVNDDEASEKLSSPVPTPPALAFNDHADPSLSETMQGVVEDSERDTHDQSTGATNPGNQLQNPSLGAASSLELVPAQVSHDNASVTDSDVFIRRAGLLDIAGGATPVQTAGSPRQDGEPEDLTEASASSATLQATPSNLHLGHTEANSAVAPSAAAKSSRVRRMKQVYVLVPPPPPEYLLRAKRRRMNMTQKGDEPGSLGNRGS